MPAVILQLGRATLCNSRPEDVAIVFGRGVDSFFPAVALEQSNYVLLASWVLHVLFDPLVPGRVQRSGALGAPPISPETESDSVPFEDVFSGRPGIWPASVAGPLYRLPCLPATFPAVIICSRTFRGFHPSGHSLNTTVHESSGLASACDKTPI